MKLPDRFWAKVSLGTGCWAWTGATNGVGYGKMWFEGKLQLSHRLAYLERHGVIPSEKPHLDHLCRNRACVNPDHLEPVTPAENVQRGNARKLDACRRGHLRTPETTRVDRDGRKCRICERIAWRDRKRQVAA
jgi:hypothetical protein